MSRRAISLAELAAHRAQTDCWIAIGDRVFDITEWLAAHPGGRSVLLSEAGTDATSIFEAVHGDPEHALGSVDQYEIGTLVAAVPADELPTPIPIAVEQSAINYVGGAALAAAALHIVLPESIAQMTPEQLTALGAGLSTATASSAAHTATADSSSAIEAPDDFAKGGPSSDGAPDASSAGASWAAARADMSLNLAQIINIDQMKAASDRVVDRHLAVW